MSSSPIRISWSGLKRWEECHQRHKLVMEGKTKVAKDVRVFLPGTVADRVMRAWLESGDPQPGQMVEMAEPFLEKYSSPESEGVVRWRGDPRKDRLTVLEFVREVVTKLEPILLREVVPYEYQPEVRFSTTVGLPDPQGRRMAVTLNGGIDIVTRRQVDPDVFVNFDLKATTNERYIAQTLGQAVFYDLAFGHWIGDSAQPHNFGFIAPALEQQLQWVKVTDSDRRAMLARIIRMAQGIYAEEWAPKESDTGCRWCEVHHACPKFAVELHVDEKGHNRIKFEEAVAARRLSEPHETT